MNADHRHKINFFKASEKEQGHYVIPKYLEIEFFLLRKKHYHLFQFKCNNANDFRLIYRRIS